MECGREKIQRSKSGYFWYRALTKVGTAVALLVFATQAAVVQEPPPGAVLRPWEPANANRIPNKNDQLQMQQEEQQQKQVNYAIANQERKRQITEDAAKIVELATDLKKEIDKTDKAQLSVTVIRKAEMIQKLAKGVKEKMKLTVGSHS